MPASIGSTLQYKLPRRYEKDYSELFISILVHVFAVNLNISCYCAIKIIEMIK
jgi:hypothetical protein